MRQMSKIPEMWIIRNSKTGEIWRAKSGKSSWKAKAHAKNAWANSYKNLSWYYWQDLVIKRCNELGIEKVFDRQDEGVNCYRVPYFDEQDVYVLEDVNSDFGIKLKEAESILRDILISYECGEEIDKKIKRYFDIE